MPLTRYREKRDFQTTPEPRGKRRKGNGSSFVVQKHAARRLHYDFRLELDGVMLSWAVPKGPALDPSVKRLAVRTEDHPLEYGDFEGTIPEGEYGGGTVMVWDRGTWEPRGDAQRDLQRGRLHFDLHGERLKGAWHLVRAGKGESDEKSQWLLFKSRDAEARADGDDEPADDASVKTGRSMAEIADGPEVWHSNRAGQKAARGRGRPRRSAKPLPNAIEPMLATLVKKPPAGDDWLHELKLDGYRIVARVEDEVALLTRGGKDWSRRMRSLAHALGPFGGRSIVLDGEAVALRPDGSSDFQLLQKSLDERADDDLRYFAFDLMFEDGEDLRRLPLEERKSRLEKLLRTLPKDSPIRFSEHPDANGDDLFARACELGAEGIVSKRRNAPYRGGRSRDWVKIKCRERHEAVIGGFTRPTGHRKGVGALLIGFPREDELIYAGKVGTGFTRHSIEELERRLAPLARDDSPFHDAPKGAKTRGVQWVEPKLVAEIEYAELTKDGLVRQASFRGLRDDKQAANVVDEVTGRELPVELTHPDRVFYEEEQITKLDLARYYQTVAALMLPHVGDRPLSLVRCPEGRKKKCFFQKHATAGLPEDVHVVELPESKGERGDYMFVRDVAGLISLAQMGVLEIHTWGSHVKNSEHPDLLVVDLDPDPDLDFKRVVEAAREVRALLEWLELQSFVKTTGGKGLHVCTPIGARLAFDDAKRLCKGLADVLVEQNPRAYVSTVSKAKRKNKIFVDYLRNARGSTFIAPYSTRARPGATVATPLDWNELTSDLDPTRFTVATVPARIARQRVDPWADLPRLRQRIGKPVLRALGIDA